MLLDQRLDLVGELAAAGVEELDAVVLVGIVRGADHDAEVALEALREIRDTRRGQRADQHHVDARGDETRFERGLEHVARQPRVLADEHRPALRREHARRGTRQLERELDRQRVLADAAPYTIGPEIVSRHDQPPVPDSAPARVSPYPAARSAAATLTASTVSATS
jgi:hypothetical protein